MAANLADSGLVSLCWMNVDVDCVAHALGLNDMQIGEKNDYRKKL